MGKKAAPKQTLKDLVKKEYDTFWENLDPQKVDFWKNELKNFAKKSAELLMVTVAVTAILLVIDLHSHGRVLPGVKVGAANIGYLKQADAQSKLENEAAARFQAPIQFRYEGFEAQVSPADMGIWPEMERSGKKIPVFDFGKNNVFTLMATLLGGGHTETVHYILDGDKAVKTLEKTFHLAERRAKNARIALEGKEAVILPESEGVAINRKQLIVDIRSFLDEPLASQAGPIEVEIFREKPQVAASDLEKEKQRLLSLLQSGITLKHKDNTANIRLIDHLGAVSFRQKDALQMEGLGTLLPVLLPEENFIANAQVTSNIQIAVNEENLEEYLKEQLLEDIEIPTSPAIIQKDENGNIVIEGKGENGKSVPRQKLKEALELAVNSGVSQVQIPVHIDHAPLTVSDELKALGIQELLATGHSAYYGSPTNRMFNIDHGTQKYNGLLVAPGEEFSFNTVLGEVDGASGFKPEKVIKGNKIEVEYGGGICQVSTTLYRAVLQAGLPITERKPHSWKVSYYSQSMGDGLDATIYPGVVDLKFLNDTGTHMLIQGYTDGSELYFKLYGTKDGRVAELDGPYGSGLNFRWNRILTKKGETITEEIWSNYKPIPPSDPLPVQQ